jgi:ABC-type multidrug transport system fused ATPase/permease subunit
MHERAQEVGRHILNLRRTEGALVATLSGTRQVLRSVLLLLGGILFLRGQIGLGALAVFIVAVGPLSRAVNAIAQFVSDFGRAETSLERIEGLFREMENEGEVQGNQALISLPFPDATTVHFEDVSFSYPNGPLLLDVFNASFHAGELIALTGPSGSGRTTFGLLLNRLLDPDKGRIALGRTDLKRFRLDVLRTYVTVVDHEPFFGPGTVFENLLLGAEESSEVRDQEISEALHAANAYDFVQALPEKLDTVIGEGGFELSVSQLRRLSLARAFLRTKSQIFVLDEPTTRLDPDSASAVVTAIHRLAERGAMVFWITNRLEEIKQADRVALFSRNQNPRLGTHQELLEKDQIYRSYFAPVEPPRANRERFLRQDRDI